jgi:hypothetical protein
MSNHLNVNFGIKKNYDQEVEKVRKNIAKDSSLKGSSIDQKRQISSKDKYIVWNKSISNSNFDEAIFRSDLFGSVAVKGLHFGNTLVSQKKFVFDYEHIVAHSENGRSVKENICILNAGINRAKGSKPLTSLNFYEFKGFVQHYSITFDELLEDLENNLHSTCSYYDLHFFKNKNGKWSIVREPNGVKYRNYSQVSYKPRKYEVVLRTDHQPNLESKILIGTAAATSFLVVANALGSQIYKSGESVVNFVEDLFFKKEITLQNQELPEKKEEPSIFTTTAIGSLVLGALAIGLKACVDAEFKTEKNKKRKY